MPRPVRSAPRNFNLDLPGPSATNTHASTSSTQTKEKIIKKRKLMIPVQSESEEEVVQTVKAVKKKKKLVKKAEIEQEIPILQEKVKPKRAVKPKTKPKPKIPSPSPEVEDEDSFETHLHEEYVKSSKLAKWRLLSQLSIDDFMNSLVTFSVRAKEEARDCAHEGDIEEIFTELLPKFAQELETSSVPHVFALNRFGKLHSDIDIFAGQEIVDRIESVKVELQRVNEELRRME